MYFQRGSLSEEQTKLVLRDLPVDVSFADENDVLVYWSGSMWQKLTSLTGPHIHTNWSIA